MNIFSIGLELNLQSKAYKVWILAYFELLKILKIEWFTAITILAPITWGSKNLYLKRYGWFSSTIIFLTMIYTYNRKIEILEYILLLIWIFFIIISKTDNKFKVSNKIHESFMTCNRCILSSINNIKLDFYLNIRW
jgi:hypothetical protein